MSSMHEVAARAADPKLVAAEEAVRLVRSGMVLGLGTGSTAKFAVLAIGRLLGAGDLEGIVGIPTSTETRKLAEAEGIPLGELASHRRVDLTIDGADEVDPAGNLLKGGGGALLWEKIVATASDRFAVVVDDSKLVSRLCEHMALPVEVVRFGWKSHEAVIRSLGADPVLRTGSDGTPFVSDEGHYILDCRFPEGLANPSAVNEVLRNRPGVVETGLFLGMSPEVFVGRRSPSPS